MKQILFAHVNGKEIFGEDIIRARNRILSEHEHNPSFARIPNDNNLAFLNTEALQKLIEINALLALAKFEGLTITDEEISTAIFELRSQYQDEAEWESVLHDLGISDKNLREDIYSDLLIDKLIQSKLDYVDAPSEESIEEFYQQNLEFMKLPNIYTFIELEIPSQEQLSLAAQILSHQDSHTISIEAAQHKFHFVLNDHIPFNKLPDPLQSILEDLEEGKIGTLATDDSSIILIKLLQKISGKVLNLEDAAEGLKEYLKIQQNQSLLDTLIEDSIERCDIIYHHTELLKDLK